MNLEILKGKEAEEERKMIWVSRLTSYLEGRGIMYQEIEVLQKKENRDLG